MLLENYYVHITIGIVFIFLLYIIPVEKGLKIHREKKAKLVPLIHIHMYVSKGSHDFQMNLSPGSCFNGASKSYLVPMREQIKISRDCTFKGVEVLIWDQWQVLPLSVQKI